MSNDYYDEETLKNYWDWEDNVIDGARARVYDPPLILVKDMHYQSTGFRYKCPKCRSVIDNRFDNYSIPLEERFTKCAVCNSPNSRRWLSAIKLIVN